MPQNIENGEEVTQISPYHKRMMTIFPKREQYNLLEQSWRPLPLAQLAAQLHRSTAMGPMIDKEEFIRIDDNIPVFPLVTE